MSKWDEYKNLKLNESCMLNNLLNDNVVINPCLNLIEIIYSWSWKLAIIDFLLEVESPLTRSQITILTWASDHWTDFQIVGSPLSSTTYKEHVGLLFSRSWFAVSVQRLNLNSILCWLAVIKMSNHRQCPKTKSPSMFDIG